MKPFVISAIEIVTKGLKIFGSNARNARNIFPIKKGLTPLVQEDKYKEITL
jgi:hypothetical protein